ncbi:MAG: hypothetical protein P8N76_03900 [Pirellulaceae bacterium]|nr:hypothetical protein [Pirellulaceae bacterium]
MNSGRPISSVDWTSRIISVVSGLVAVIAIGLAMTQQPVVPQTSELITEFEQALKKESDLYAKQKVVLENEFRSSLQANDNRMKGWNDQIVSALNQFEQDAQNLVDQIAATERQAKEQRVTAFRQEIATIRQLTARENQSAVEATPESPNQDPANQDTASETNETQPPTIAQLTVAESVMRPANGDFTLIRIENNSSEDAEIYRLQFQPVSDFRVDSPESLSEAGTDQVTTISYSAADNTSTKPGHHGIYDRTLTDRIRVPAGQAVTVRLIIEDKTFVGWGFAGNLLVQYNAQDPLVVKSARVRFAPVEPEVSADPEVADEQDLIGQST